MYYTAHFPRRRTLCSLEYWEPCRTSGFNDIPLLKPFGWIQRDILWGSRDMEFQELLSPSTGCCLVGAWFSKWYHVPTAWVSADVWDPSWSPSKAMLFYGLQEALPDWSPGPQASKASPVPRIVGMWTAGDLSLTFAPDRQASSESQLIPGRQGASLPSPSIPQVFPVTSLLFYCSLIGAVFKL